MLKQTGICEHLQNLEIKPAASYQCDECVALGDTWVHLRACQTCGKVSCCNDSKNQHATKHFQATQHPVVISAEPGERWAWCYADEIMVMY